MKNLDIPIHLLKQYDVQPDWNNEESFHISMSPTMTYLANRVLNESNGAKVSASSTQKRGVSFISNSIKCIHNDKHYEIDQYLEYRPHKYQIYYKMKIEQKTLEIYCDQVPLFDYSRNELDEVVSIPKPKTTCRIYGKDRKFKDFEEWDEATGQSKKVEGTSLLEKVQTIIEEKSRPSNIFPSRIVEKGSNTTVIAVAVVCVAVVTAYLLYNRYKKQRTPA